MYIDKIKYSVEGKEIMPDNFLIPDFIIGNKKELKISSGFDAIAQAMESIISLRSNEKVYFMRKNL